MSVEKFRELFGQAIDPFNYEVFVEVSANRWLALVNKDKFDLNFSKYLLKYMPKEDERFEVIKKDDLFFDLKVIRTILNNFVGSGVINMAIMTHEKEHALLIDIGDYYMMLAEKIANRSYTNIKYEIIHNWNDIFTESKIGNDMIL